MANEDRAERYTAVIALLSRDHRAADEPPFALIARVSDELASAERVMHGVQVEHVARSTANDVMRGVHTRRLRWELVESLWAVIHYIAEQNEFDTRAMTSWHELHRSFHQAPTAAAATAAHETDGPLAAGPTPSRPARTPPAPSVPALPRLRPQRPTRGRLARGIDASACDTGLICPDPLDAGLGPVAGDGSVLRSDPYDESRRRLARARLRGSDVWWRDYRHVVPAWFGPYLTLEPELALIRIYAPRRIPGLLQTADYARHVIAEDLPDIPADELAQRIELRQVRQQLLRRPDAPRYWAVIDQRALARRAAPPAVLRGQLRHMIAMAAYSHITVQLVRGTDAERVVPAGPITMMRFPETGVGDLVFLEQNDHGIYVDDRESVEYFSLRYHRLAVNAMEPHDSVSLLLEKLDRLQP